MKPRVTKRYLSLFAQSSQQRVLGVLFGSPEKEFSLSDLAKEAHVFIEGNQLIERWSNACIDTPLKFFIGEIMKKVMRKLDPNLLIKDKIAEITSQITKLTNDMFMKQGILEDVLKGKTIAKERIAKAFKTGITPEVELFKAL